MGANNDPIKNGIANSPIFHPSKDPIVDQNPAGPLDGFLTSPSSSLSSFLTSSLFPPDSSGCHSARRF
ncbi:MAG TPA: hypothetical protein P5052_00060 [Candidatus Paceibacterota bacterium]|nr:hypothetical protein [Candidatus Paceibacterota bacterium]HRZ29218.1 hypothetical protein [Candidatus Paceibacterota bacterium]